jgi:hypothetical protein
MTPDDLPDYMKAKSKKQTNKNSYTYWFEKNFTTHPELEDRIHSVEKKISADLPFDHYVSRLKKIRNSFAILLDWRYATPLASCFIIFFTWTFFSIRSGDHLVQFVKSNDSKAILNNREIQNSINKKPYIVGKSLMSFIVKKRDSQLIDYYLKNGADPGRAMIYLAETKDFNLFKKFYVNYAPKLSQDEYYLVLLRTAELNAVDSYRFLVNSNKFELLNPEYKTEVVDHMRVQHRERKPASEKK